MTDRFASVMEGLAPIPDEATLGSGGDRPQRTPVALLSALVAPGRPGGGFGEANAECIPDP